MAVRPFIIAGRVNHRVTHGVEADEPLFERLIRARKPEDVADMKEPLQIGTVHIFDEPLEPTFLPAAIRSVPEHPEREAVGGYSVGRRQATRGRHGDRTGNQA